MPPKKSRGSKRDRDLEDSAAEETGALLSPNHHGAAHSDIEENDAVPRSSPKGRSSQKSQGSKRSSQKGAKEESVAEHPLLELLCSGAAMTTTVDDLVSLYQSDAESAVAVLVTTICRASGVPDTVTVDRTAIVEADSIVSTLEEVYARVPEGAGAVTYLLINKDTKYRRFKKSLPEFFSKLIIAVTDATLDDGILLSQLTTWLSHMGESKARSFRHTASTALFAVLNGLLERMHAANEALSLCRNKKEVAQAQKKKDHITLHFDQVFKHSITPRTKDIAPEIRSLALKELRGWIVSYPELLLEHKCLLYFVAALHDKRAEVRAEALECFVQLLGDNSEHLEKLHDFLKKYGPRIAEMASDLDTRVANLALKVCALIIRAEHDTGAEEELLNNDHIDSLLLALADDRLAIRNTAGILLKVFINCRTAQDDETEQSQQRAEILSSFTGTMRKEFEEPWAERYLVDAMWSDANPPVMLTHFKPFINLAVATQDPNYCNTLLRLLAAILERLNGPLFFGPVPRDDLKVDVKKNKEFDAAALKKKISTEVISALGKIHMIGANDDVTEGACQLLCHLDLSVLSQDRLANRFKDVVNTLVKCTLTTGSRSLLKSLMEAWQTLSFIEHPQKKTAGDGLQDIVTSVLKQLTKADKTSIKRGGHHSQQATEEQEKEHIGVWNRVAAVTSLIALPDQLPIFKHDLTKQLNNKASPALLTGLVESCYTTALWFVGQKDSDASISDDDVANTVGEIITLLLKVASVDSELSGTKVVELRVLALINACDLASLPFCTLPASEQTDLLHYVNQTFAGCHDVMEVLSASLKQNIQMVGSVNLSKRTSRVTGFRKSLSLWEANCTNLATAVVRLFTFSRLDEAKAPATLLQWTKLSAFSKPAADLYKGLFHTMRDRSTSSAELEQNILAAGLEECKEVGGQSNVQGMEAFFALGSKLSSIHFVPNDKHYPDVVAIVKWGMDYAANTDPMVLHAVAPFCTRLRVADALSIANSVANNDFFSTISADSHSAADIAARSFIGGLRRAAKLEEPVSGRGFNRAGGVTPASGTVRGTRTSGRRTAPEEDNDLANIVGTSASVGVSSSSAKKKVADDGWRSRGGATAVASSQQATVASTQKSGGVMTQTQESGFSGLEDDSEQFIATQEWN